MNANHSNTFIIPASDGISRQIFSTVMQRVYGWMAAGLLVTAGVAWFVAISSLVK